MRLWEFAESLCVVRDSVEAIRAGRGYMLRALAGQLRVLLTDRSKRTTPLMFEIANHLNRSLTLYHGPGAMDPEEAAKDGPDPLLFIMAGFPISVVPQFADQVESDLKGVLALNVFRFDGEVHTIADLINAFANQAGGAHSPPNWAKNFAGLHSVGLGGNPAPVTALIQIADAVQLLGAGLLRSVGSLELYLGVAIPDQPLEHGAVLLHVDYAPLLASVSVRLHPLHRLQFEIVTIHQQRISVISDIQLDLTKPHYCGLYHTITDDLRTEVTIMVDGLQSGHSRFDAILMMPGENTTYQLMVNRTPEDPNAGCRLGLNDVFLGATLQPLHDLAARILKLHDGTVNLASRCVVLERGQFALGPSETGGLGCSEGARSDTVTSLFENNQDDSSDSQPSDA